LPDSPVISTRRLQIRWLLPGDAAFIHQLLNDPDWLRYIGDKNVDSREDARVYLEQGPIAMYRSHGFGLNRVATKHDDQAIGICGLLRRDGLPEADLGIALLKQHRNRGYALEAARAVLDHARDSLGISRVMALVDPANGACLSLLEKLEFTLDNQTSGLSGNPELSVLSPMALT